MRLAGRREFKWEGIRYRKRGRLWRLGAAGLLAVAVLGLGVFASGVVFASHNFSDVPTGAFYHNAVEWVFNRGITAGCAAGMYCPNDTVTRGTMAVFLRALGVALTPTYLEAAENNSVLGLDPDSNPVICQTTDFSVTGYPRTALVNGQAVLNPTGSMGVGMSIVYSTNGGVSWASLNYYEQKGSAAAGGYTFGVNSYARIDLAVGTTYRLGIRVSRAFGIDDANFYSCELRVATVNRNGTSSPLSPSR